MAKFKIISKDGLTTRAEGCPKYTGSHLGVAFLEFDSINSPTLINWQRGDYVVYSRTGLTYRLYTEPLPKKQAESGSYGAAFVYSNVKFYASTKDLEIAPFRDVVTEDNNIHFSTRPEVSTFENVYGIASRIQENLNDLYPGKWEIRVFDTTDDDLLALFGEAKDFSVSNGSCLDALSHIYETWKNVGWIHTYDSNSGKDVITIGRSSLRDEQNTTDAYAYGVGKGLTSIKKAAANEGEFATRLYVYGSDRNIQTRYYNGLDIHNKDSVNIVNLMLPLDKWGKTDGKPDARKAYLQASDEIVAKYGLIPRIVYFDGSSNEEIYPSITGLTEGKVRAAMIDAGQSSSPLLPPNTEGRIDEVLSCLFTDDDGSKQYIEANRKWTLWVRGVGFNIADQGKLTEEGYATISMKGGACAGREFKVLSSRVVDYAQELTLERTWDESLGMGFPNGIYRVEAGDQFVLLDIPMPDYYITLAEERLLEAGRKMLEDYTRVSAFYEPGIDSINIYKGAKILREGMYMQVYDKDVIDTEDNRDYVLIDTLTIDEKSELPKYSVTLREQKRSARSFGVLEEMIEDVKSVSDKKIERQRQYTERRFQDAKETISMLEKAMLDGFTESISPLTVQTMSMLVGDESLQFRFVSDKNNASPVDSTIMYNKDTKKIESFGDVIQHMTLGIEEVSSSRSVHEYKFWEVGSSDLNPDEADKAYFLYIRASKSSSSASLILSPTAIAMESESGFYHFLTAILNSESDGDRSLCFLNGFTEILPGQITTDTIRDSDGKLVIDLANATITATDGAKIIGDIEFGSGSSGLNNIPEWSKTNEELVGVKETLENIQDQIDGVVENYFLEGEPTTKTPPVSDWLADVSEEERDAVLLEHVGDTYTNISETGETAGKSWRWCECVNTEAFTDYIEVTDAQGNKKKLHWHPISDTDALKALEMAAKAQSTADGKRRVFINTPSGPYDEGDLWSQGSTGDLMVCKTPRQSGYSASDWKLATKYTDGLNIKNLIPNSAEMTSGTSEYSHVRILLPVRINAGEEYTFKCESSAISSGSDSSYIVYFTGESNNTWYSNKHELSFGEDRYVTIKINDTVNGVAIKNNLAWLVLLKKTAPSNYKAIFNNLSLVRGSTPMSKWEEYVGDATLNNILEIEEEYVGSYNDNFYYSELLPFTVNAKERYTFHIEDLEIASGTAPDEQYKVVLSSSSDISTSYNISVGEGGWGTLVIYDGVSNSNAKLNIWKRGTSSATARIKRLSLVKGSTPLMTWEENPNTTKKKLEEWASDGYFSPTEIGGLKEEQTRLDQESAKIVTAANLYSVDTTSFNSAKNNYATIIGNVISAYNNAVDKTKAIAVDKTDFNTKMSAYYSEKATIEKSIDNATKTYTDTSLSTFISQQFNVLKSQVDGKIDTWYQSNDPSLAWTDEEKANHKGDLWYVGGESKIYNGSGWDLVEGVPEALYGEVGRKKQVFYGQPTTPYDVSDLWVQGENGDLMVCKTKRESGGFNSADWTLATKYTDGSNTKNLIPNSAEVTTGISEYTHARIALPIKVSAGEEYTFKCESSSLTSGSDTAYDVYITGVNNNVWFSTKYQLPFGKNQSVTIKINATSGGTAISQREAWLVLYKKTYPDKGANKAIFHNLSLVSGKVAMSRWEDNYEYLYNAFKNGTTKVNGGLVMTQAVMVEDANGTVKGMLNGSDWGKDSTDGKLILAAGSNGSTESAMREATTRIYEMGKIVTKHLVAKGDVEIGGSVRFTPVTLQDAFSSGSLQSSYNIGSNPPTYLSFSGAQHQGMGSVSLVFTKALTKGRTIEIFCEPIISRIDATLRLSGLDFYLPTISSQSGLATKTTSITINGGKIELYYSLDGNWIVTSPITSNITIA